MKLNLISNTAENTRVNEGRQEFQISTYTGARPLTHPRTFASQSDRNAMADAGDVPDWWIRCA